MYQQQFLRPLTQYRHTIYLRQWTYKLQVYSGRMQNSTGNHSTFKQVAEGQQPHARHTGKLLYTCKETPYTSKIYIYGHLVALKCFSVTTNLSQYLQHYYLWSEDFLCSSQKSPYFMESRALSRTENITTLVTLLSQMSPIYKSTSPSPSFLNKYFIIISTPVHRSWKWDLSFAFYNQTFPHLSYLPWSLLFLSSTLCVLTKFPICKQLSIQLNVLQWTPIGNLFTTLFPNFPADF